MQVLLNGVCLVLIIVNLLLITAATYYSDTRLLVRFFDVGQGDSFLVRTPDKLTMLVDGGEGKALLTKLSEHLAPFDQVDIVLLTHAHADHVGALGDVVNTQNVHTVFVNPSNFETSEYTKFLQSVDNKDLRRLEVGKGERYKLGCCVLMNFLWPDNELQGSGEALIDSANQESISFLLQYGNFDFLSSGDLEGSLEEDVGNYIRTNDLLKDGTVDLVKISHHGSDTSTSEKYLNIIRPEVAVMQVGKDNSYNHPSQSVVKQIDQIGVQSFRTDLGGNITYLTDSYTYFIQPDK
jgi:competence protein ComEC